MKEKNKYKKTEREEQSRSPKAKKIRTTLLNCIHLLKVGQYVTIKLLNIYTRE